MKSFNHLKELHYPVEAPEPCITEVLSVEKVLVDGRPLSKSVVKVDDPRTRYAGISADDFLLENQLEVGVQLTPSIFHLSKMEICQSIDTIMSQEAKSE